EKLLLGRKVVRFVIDEAHCFSSLGQDFRVDYLYIGDFIKSLQTTKNLEEQIPVSCFTATAKQKVIEDIYAYFKEKLGIKARAFHGKMESQEKTENQNAFIAGDVQIMVATSAFGMGVDKKDVGMVIHYEISDSLENYVQEAGRAGRDENITADCFVLFNEEDLAKHF